MSRRKSQMNAFLDSITIPGVPSAAIGASVLLVLLVFWRLRLSPSSPWDVTTLYEINTILIYGPLIGGYLLFMIFSLRRSVSIPRQAPRVRFLCLVPAYNEESVIENSIKSLLEQHYPRSMYDVVLVFDGEDGTGDIARRLGAKVIETPEKGSGKHAALAHAIDLLVEDEDSRYVCVFDADNIVAPNFLQGMNDAVVTRGYRCMQAYHDVLNRHDNWVTKGLWAATQASSRLYNRGRYRSLGTALICGTGWCCLGGLLKKYWPEIKTQTEDIELTGLLRLHEREGVAWISSTRFYDEKPRTLWVAIRQRRRWMTGHMRVFRRLGWKCLKEGFQRRDPALIELAVYYAVPFLMSASIIQFFIVGAGICAGVFCVSGLFGSRDASLAFHSTACWYLFVYPVLGLGLGAGEWRKGPIYALYAFFFSLVVWTIALVWAWFSLFRRDWIFHTPHVACTSLQQLFTPYKSTSTRRALSESAGNYLKIGLIAFLLLPLSITPTTMAEDKMLLSFVPNEARFDAWLDTMESEDAETRGLYPYFGNHSNDEEAAREFLSPMVSAKSIIYRLRKGQVQQALRTGEALLHWQKRSGEDVDYRAIGALPSEIIWNGKKWESGDRYYSGDNLVVLEALLRLYEKTGKEEFFLGSRKIATWLKNIMCEGKDMGVWLEDYFAPMRFVTADGNFDNRIFLNTEFLWIEALQHYGEIARDESFIMQYKLAVLFYLHGQAKNGAWYDHYDPGYPPRPYSDDNWRWYGEDGTLIADNAIRAALGAYRVGARDKAALFMTWLRPERGAVPAYLDAATGTGRFDASTEPYYDVVVSGLLRVLASELGYAKTVMATEHFLAGTQNMSGGWYWGVRQVDRAPVETREAVITGLWAVSNLIQ